MAKHTVRLAPQAAAWFLAEIHYLLEHDLRAAEALVERFRKLQAQLADFPNIGQRGSIPGTRRVVFSPYIVTMRKKGGAIEIVAIRHARQGDARAPNEARDGDDVES